MFHRIEMTNADYEPVPVVTRCLLWAVTGLDVMDSFSVRTLRDMAHMIRLRGADTVIVGIQPEVAFSMVQLGLSLEGVPTALDLEEGLAYLDARPKRSVARKLNEQ